MKPDKAGIWEWFDEDGTKRLVEVCDVGFKDAPWLRVYWWGGYYSVEESVGDLVDTHGNVVQKDYREEAQWPDRWGAFIGESGCVPEEQVHLGPTPEQMERIRNLEKRLNAINQQAQ